ncbi:MAG TPA: response regulator transcription factor [Jiangellales bacterium]|nr:response regulator transcription factor [Jiangellales bacterium]
MLTSNSAVLSRAPDGWRPRFLLLIADPALDPASPSVAELTRQHVDVKLCADAAEALVLAGTMHPDAVVVAADPGPISCSHFVRVLSRHIEIPTVVGIGAGEGDHADAALSAGATACIARPYRLPELIPILRSIRPETIGTLEPVLECGGLRLDPATLEVRLHGRPIRLPLREYHLLRFFMIHVDRVLTREQIYDSVWGSPVRDASNTLTVHIKRLRRRLGDQRDRQMILTVRGLGYRLVPPPPLPVTEPARPQSRTADPLVS